MGQVTMCCLMLHDKGNPVCILLRYMTLVISALAWVSSWDWPEGSFSAELLCQRRGGTTQLFLDEEFPSSAAVGRNFCCATCVFDSFVNFPLALLDAHLAAAWRQRYSHERAAISHLELKNV